MGSVARLAVAPEEARELLQGAGALLEGHFLLSSGLHSPRYVQCATLLEDPVAASRVAAAMAPACRELDAQVVLAPALGAILFGYELARHLGLRNIFAERPSGAFELRRGFTLAPGERVLLAENVVTTGGSVEETARMAQALGAEVAGYAVIVDRSGGRFSPAQPVVAYAALDVEVHPPTVCPQCAAGVPVMKPGSRKF